MARTSTPPGAPLPDDHPFKNGCVIFGMKRPVSSAKTLTQKEEMSDTKSSPEEDNSFDIAAHTSADVRSEYGTPVDGAESILGIHHA